MKANFLALGLFGLAGASAILPREYPEEKYPEQKYPEQKYDPKYPEQKYDPKYPEEKYHEKYPEEKYHEKYPEEKYHEKYPEEKYHEKYPEKYHEDKYPEKKYPEKKYPEKKYPEDKYPEKYREEKYPEKDYKPSYDDSYDSYPSKGGKKHKRPSYPKEEYSDDYDEEDYEDGYSYKDQKGSTNSWKPKSKSPEFFNLRVDEKCNVDGDVPETPYECPLNGYAIRLEGGIFIATPYNKWWDPKLPTFFVDDDTQLYTVSKDPLQVYIDGVTGALKYTKIGWLPPNAIAISFYHTGNNPLGLVDPSPSYLSWPSTQGGSFYGSPWILCPLGGTQQYQVFINSENFGNGGPAGVTKDAAACVPRNLAAVNANPWKQDSPAPYYPPGPGGYPPSPGGYPPSYPSYPGGSGGEY